MYFKQCILPFFFTKSVRTFTVQINTYSHDLRNALLSEKPPARKEANDKYDFGEGNMKSVLVSSQFSKGGVQFITDSFISLLLSKQFI